PANLTRSSSFNKILLTPTVYCDEVTYWVDMDATVNNPVTFKLPEIFTSFVIPTPPATTSAPSAKLVLLVVLLIV
ncbi:MAG: hypothetical protein ACK55Z_02040, partial [bacterium]